MMRSSPSPRGAPGPLTATARLHRVAPPGVGIPTCRSRGCDAEPHTTCAPASPGRSTTSDPGLPPAWRTASGTPLVLDRAMAASIRTTVVRANRPTPGAHDTTTAASRPSARMQRSEVGAPEERRSGGEAPEPATRRLRAHFDGSTPGGGDSIPSAPGDRRHSRGYTKEAPPGGTGPVCACARSPAPPGVATAASSPSFSSVSCASATSAASQ